MKKIYFILSVIIFLIAAVALTACESADDLVGEATYVTQQIGNCDKSQLGETKCAVNRLGSGLLFECASRDVRQAFAKRDSLGRPIYVRGRAQFEYKTTQVYFWSNTRKKCEQEPVDECKIMQEKVNNAEKQYRMEKSVYDEKCGSVTDYTKCTDSDSGLNYYVAGIAKGKNSAGNDASIKDYCSGTSLKVEGICNEKGYVESGPDHLCPAGCSDGACNCLPYQGRDYADSPRFVQCCAGNTPRADLWVKSMSGQQQFVCCEGTQCAGDSVCFGDGRIVNYNASTKMKCDNGKWVQESVYTTLTTGYKCSEVVTKTGQDSSYIAFRDVQIPMFNHDGYILFGNGLDCSDGRLLLQGDSCNADSIDELEGVRFFVVDFNGGMHIFELKNINQQALTVDLLDITTQKTYQDQKLDPKSGGLVALDGIGKIKIPYSHIVAYTPALETDATDRWVITAEETIIGKSPVDIDQMGKRVDFNFMNTERKEVRISFSVDEATGRVLGGKDSKIDSCMGRMLLNTYDSCTGRTINELEEIQLLTCKDKAIHVIEIDNIDSVNLGMSLVDVTYDKNYKDKKILLSPMGSPDPFDVVFSDLGTLGGLIFEQGTSAISSAPVKITATKLRFQ